MGDVSRLLEGLRRRHLVVSASDGRYRLAGQDEGEGISGVDLGAVTDPKPAHVVQFALMGQTYARYVLIMTVLWGAGNIMIISLAGLGFSAMWVFPGAMVADIIDEDARRTGQGRAHGLAAH